MNKWESKCNSLAEIEGYLNSDYLVEDYIMESTVPGICMNELCDFTTMVEPDQRKGHCANCGTKTVESCLSLKGLA